MCKNCNVQDRQANLHVNEGVQKLLDIISRLRGEGGCPWDREQTLDSLKHCLIEESYEVVDAVSANDFSKLKEELGDVLLQVLLQSHISSEQGKFDFNDVTSCLSEKLIRRHPHVFGDAKVSDSQDVLKKWEIIKAGEKKGQDHSVVDGDPRHLPALHRAQQVQSRVARVGFDWSKIDEVMKKVEEEFTEVKQAVDGGNHAEMKEEIGDILFAVVNLSRFLKINAEEALEFTITKFKRRFKEVERRVKAEGRELTDCSLAEMDVHWEDIKKEGESRA